MRRKLTLKPVLLVELLMVAMLFGIGSAFALTVNPLPGNPSPWAGTDTITDSAHLSVTDYEFVWSDDLTQAVGVNVTVANSDTADHVCDIDVAVSNGGTPATASDSQTIAGGESRMFNLTLDSAVDLAELSWINIMLLEDA